MLDGKLGFCTELRMELSKFSSIFWEPSPTIFKNKKSQNIEEKPAVEGKFSYYNLIGKNNILKPLRRILFASFFWKILMKFFFFEFEGFWIRGGGNLAHFGLWIFLGVRWSNWLPLEKAWLPAQSDITCMESCLSDKSKSSQASLYGDPAKFKLKFSPTFDFKGIFGHDFVL